MITGNLVRPGRFVIATLNPANGLGGNRFYGLGWVLAWGYLDGLERVLVSNGLGWVGLIANASWDGLMKGPNG